MTCNWCEERFERFLEHELVAADRGRLLAHVDRCEPCRSLLDELRVVDAVLLRPRPIQPADDFTAATMADVRALPPPSAPPARLPAYIVCYVIGAWGLIAAGFVLAPHVMFAFGATAREIARTIVVAVGGVAHVATHVGERGEFRSWTTVAGAMVIVDVTLVLMLVAVRRLGSPWMRERRS